MRIKATSHITNIQLQPISHFDRRHEILQIKVSANYWLDTQIGVISEHVDSSIFSPPIDEALMSPRFLTRKMVACVFKMVWYNNSLKEYSNTSIFKGYS